MTIALRSTTTTDAPPPSRDANPFATCWTRPGALPWIESNDQRLTTIIDRLRDAQWRGQIIGPHGAGKSTLMRAIRQSLVEAGRQVVSLDVSRPAADDSLQVVARTEADRLVMIEGFERLGWHARHRWLKATREAKLGLLVTTHRRMPAWRSPMPVVAVVVPNESLVEALFKRLTTERTTPVTLRDARDSFSRQRGNLREVWFDLYDLHEQRTRQHRTRGGTAS